MVGSIKLPDAMFSEIPHHSFPAGNFILSNHDNTRDQHARAKLAVTENDYCFVTKVFIILQFKAMSFYDYIEAYAVVMVGGRV